MPSVSVSHSGHLYFPSLRLRSAGKSWFPKRELLPGNAAIVPGNCVLSLRGLVLRGPQMKRGATLAGVLEPDHEEEIGLLLHMGQEGTFGIQVIYQSVSGYPPGQFWK